MPVPCPGISGRTKKIVKVGSNATSQAVRRASSFNSVMIVQLLYLRGSQLAGRRKRRDKFTLEFDILHVSAYRGRIAQGTILG